MFTTFQHIQPRKINFGPRAMSKTMNFQKFGMFLLLWLFSVSSLFLVSVNEAAAQRPGSSTRGGSSSRGGSERRGPSSEQIFGYLDSDKNGRLDPKEIDNARGPFKEMLSRAGVDYRKGLDQRSFSSAFDKIRKQREQESQSRGGNDDDRRKREEYERRKREYEQKRQEYEKRKEEERSKKEGSSKRTPTSIAFRAKERVTVDIPQTFVDGDNDGDGQIGFYEWKKWKRDEIRQFAAYDRNGDGFLTPRELEKGPAELPQSTTLVVSASSTSPKTTSKESNESSSTKSKSTKEKEVKDVSAPAGVDMNSVAARRGASMFRLLDRDKDGKIAAEEWSRARTTKPLFEQGGLDLSKPMSKNDFLANYVRLSGS